MNFLKLDEIPDDLQEMIYEVEHIHGTYSDKFEKAMFDNKLMEYGTVRRSHRVLTKKCIDLDYEGTVELLTGLTSNQIEAIHNGVSKAEDIKDMFETAKEYGYVIIEKDLRKYL